MDKNNGNQGFKRVNQSTVARKIGRMEARMRAARSRKPASIWRNFSVIGLVGWSVGIPTLIGIAIGLWLDSRYNTRHSWTLIMLFVGLVIGCLNAWYWVSREREEIEEESNEPEEGPDHE